MKAFDNQLICEVPYENGLFPKIPNFRKQHSVYILTGGSGDSIVVDEYTTTREIRQGKYNKLVEVSTVPYTKEITFNSSSKETSFSFEVYVKAIIQVKNPITFYNNRNIDVEAYFNSVFSLDVRKITRTYSILDFDGMDEELTSRLGSYNTFDESTGFEYRVSIVEAQPGEEARSYVRKHNTQNLDASLKVNARQIGSSLRTTYDDAVWAEVANGELSETEAIIKIQEYENSSIDNKIKRINEMRDFISDTDANKMVKHLLSAQGLMGTTDKSLLEATESPTSKDDDATVLDAYY